VNDRRYRKYLDKLDFSVKNTQFDCDAVWIKKNYSNLKLCLVREIGLNLSFRKYTRVETSREILLNDTKIKI
jgi:hypothetical protein